MQLLRLRCEQLSKPQLFFSRCEASWARSSAFCEHVSADRCVLSKRSPSRPPRFPWKLVSWQADLSRRNRRCLTASWAAFKSCESDSQNGLSACSPPGSSKYSGRHLSIYNRMRKMKRWNERTRLCFFFKKTLNLLKLWACNYYF